jgi:hypothetical protein
VRLDTPSPIKNKFLGRLMYSRVDLNILNATLMLKCFINKGQ